MKLVLVMLSLMITIACCAPEGVEPKFKKGEIVMIEGEKFVVDYSISHSDEKTFVYNVTSLKDGHELDINENSISKYIKDETHPEVDSTYITESDTIAY
jgi:hypothetical protein